MNPLRGNHFSQWQRLSVCKRRVPCKAKEGRNKTEYVQSSPLHRLWPEEGFWGILKRKMRYSLRFTDQDILAKTISDYIDYYNNKRLQKRLSAMAPRAYHNLNFVAAKNLPKIGRFRFDRIALILFVIITISS